MKSWTDFKNAINSKIPELYRGLNSGADEADICNIESKMRVLLPQQLIELYKENNGDDENLICGIIMGFHFYSIDEMYSEWKTWKDISSNPDFMNGYKGTSTPENYIKKMYANPKWIPICGDGSGNHIGIDLDPDVNGKSGQIITFGTDESNKIVIAEDLNSFFERLTRIVNSNHFSIDEFDDENVISLNIDEDYGIFLIDYFKMNTAVK